VVDDVDLRLYVSSSSLRRGLCLCFGCVFLVLYGVSGAVWLAL